MNPYLAPLLSVAKEPASTSAPVQGELPKELRGTLLRNGPGLFEASGGAPLHFLDGHAMVCAMRFGDGRADLHGRIVRTGELTAEAEAGRMLYRRLFTNLPNRWSNLFKLPKGDNGNHDVYVHGGQLVASNDLGHWALDPHTLETLRPERFDGFHAPGQLIAPMPRVDPATGRLVGWAIKPGGARPDRLRFFEADEGFRVVSETAPLTLASSPAIVHDQGFSARWYVATQASARLPVLPALWGKRTVLDCVTWNGGATTDLIVVSRPDGARAHRIPLPPEIRAGFHVINAYDDGEQLVVDAVLYPGAPDFAIIGAERAAKSPPGAGTAPTPTRLVVDPVKGAIVSHRPLSHGVVAELPEVRPDRFGRGYRYVWLGAPAADTAAPDAYAFPWFGAVAKIDLETGAASYWRPEGEATFVSQPAFAPRGEAEDDGWLLVWVTDGERGTGSVVVLDARDLPRGPIARVDAGVALPGASHVTWAPQ